MVSLATLTMRLLKTFREGRKADAWAVRTSHWPEALCMRLKE